MNWKFCHLCGGELESIGSFAGKCTKCGQRIFKSQVTASDAAILNTKNQLLLVVRAKEPSKGKLDFPGGFVDHDESLEQAVLRELHEELDIIPSDIESMEYLGSGIDHYPWDHDVTFVTAATFEIRLHLHHPLHSGDDAASYRWMNLQDINPDDLLSRAQAARVAELIKKYL